MMDVEFVGKEEKENGVLNNAKSNASPAGMLSDTMRNVSEQSRVCWPPVAS